MKQAIRETLTGALIAVVGFAIIWLIGAGLTLLMLRLAEGVIK